MTNQEMLLEFLKSALANKLEDTQSVNFSFRTGTISMSDAFSESKSLHHYNIY
jgi:hypothetical protein